MIDSSKIGWLLSEFDLGASTAENDPLLETAKIETQQFQDLYWHDRIDLIRGIKGSGKTALYRLFYFIQGHLSKDRKLYCVFGVEPSGDPVFRLYQKEFTSFNEFEFENFWSIYFIALVYNLINTTPTLKSLLGKDVSILDDILSKIGLKFTKKTFTPSDSIKSFLHHFKSSKISIGMKAGVNPTTGQLTSFMPSIEIDPSQVSQISRRPIYLAEFRDSLATILIKNEIRIWIMLDRLDEVFPHRSDVEKNGLRSLLKASYNFSHPHLRTKIFLRDDIIAYLASEGFSALTHVTDRSSSTMAWSKDELLHLIVKRISSLSLLATHFTIDKAKVDKGKDYRELIFYSIFPAKIGNTHTMDWLFSSCADGNNVVTPRDMIDFFRFAKAEQFKQQKLNPKPQAYLLSVDAFKKALEDLSMHKKDTFLFAEFPHLKNIFFKFEGGYSEYSKDALAKLIGPEHAKVIDDLRGIGFIKHVPKSGTYKIPVIWRKGLNIRRVKSNATIGK